MANVRIVEVLASVPNPIGSMSATQPSTNSTGRLRPDPPGARAARARTRNPRWWVQEIGLTNDAAHPTTTALRANHAPVRNGLASSTRPRAPSTELFWMSATSPTRPESQRRSVQ